MIEDEQIYNPVINIITTTQGNMNNYLINFKNMDWDISAEGVRQKTFIRDNQRIRLVEFTENFADIEWCTNRHIGYIIEGSITINFNGKLIEFKSGDGIFIPEGEKNRHKGIIAKGEKASIIFYDDIRDHPKD